MKRIGIKSTQIVKKEGYVQSIQSTKPHRFDTAQHEDIHSNGEFHDDLLAKKRARWRNNVWAFKVKKSHQSVFMQLHSTVLTPGAVPKRQETQQQRYDLPCLRTMIPWHKLRDMWVDDLDSSSIGRIIKNSNAGDRSTPPSSYSKCFIFHGSGNTVDTNSNHGRQFELASVQ